MPCGISDNGLPIGLQISAPNWQEQELLALGRQYEDATDWHTQRPRNVAPT
jgi:aspartyl-tRNA(Asn)/glutamyl-tRNA(Gln) amidotransferase subunit A